MGTFGGGVDASSSASGPVSRQLRSTDGTRAPIMMAISPRRLKADDVGSTHRWARSLPRIGGIPSAETSAACPTIGPNSTRPQAPRRRRRSKKDGAQEKTRTSTGLPPQVPETCASTNSATWALVAGPRCGRHFSFTPGGMSTGTCGRGRTRQDGHRHYRHRLWVRPGVGNSAAEQQRGFHGDDACHRIRRFGLHRPGAVSVEARAAVARRGPRSGTALPRPMGDVGQVAGAGERPRRRSVAPRSPARMPWSISWAFSTSAGRQTFEAVHARQAGRIARGGRGRRRTAWFRCPPIGADPVGYARTKAAGEAAVRESVSRAAMVRPSIVFGPGDGFFNRFAPMARFTPALPLIGGGDTRSSSRSMSATSPRRWRGPDRSGAGRRDLRIGRAACLHLQGADAARAAGPDPHAAPAGAAALRLASWRPRSWKCARNRR